MNLLLLILLLFLLGGGITAPVWNYNRGWGYGPFGGLIGLLIFILILHYIGIF